MNIDTIRTYVDGLVGSSDYKNLAWQIIPESKLPEFKNKGFADNITGSIEEKFNYLKLKNIKERCGIFLSVNETDGKGRENENMTRVRSVCIDADNGPIDIKTLSLEPSIIVKTARGNHVYWLTYDCELAWFSDIQNQLAKKLNTCAGVTLLTQVMRVPGTWHCKYEPKLVDLISVDRNKIYSVNEIVKAFSLIHPRESIGNIGTIIPNGRKVITAFNNVKNVNGNRLKKYGMGALNSAVNKVVSTTDYRNVTLSKEAYSIGGLVAHGIIDKSEAEQKLIDAAQVHQSGDDPLTTREIKNAVIGGIEAGINNPKDISNLVDSGKKALSKHRKRPALLKTNDDGSTEMIERINIDDDDVNSKKMPYEMAEEIIQENQFLFDESKNIYKFNGKTWDSFSEDMLKSLALSKDNNSYSNKSRRAETIDRVLIDKRVVRGKIKWNALGVYEIALSDCILNVITGEKRGHGVDNYLENLVDIEYAPYATSPTLVKCLNDWFVGDVDKQYKIAVLQEFAGYILFNHAKLKKALFIYGQSNTGKSVFGQMLEMLVGKNLCCSIGIDAMDDPRKLAPIKGKKLNLITELPDEALIADGGFKKLVSSEDSIQIDAKYKNPEIYNPICKHVVCTNTLPNINDKTQATYNRLLVVEFLNVLKEEDQDQFICEKLALEIQGVLNWAIVGSKRLSANKGIFTKIKSAEETIARHRINQSPVLEFITNNYELDAEYTCSYPKFCKDFWLDYGDKFSKRTIGASLDSMKLNRYQGNGETKIKGIRPKGQITNEYNK